MREYSMLIRNTKGKEDQCSTFRLKTALSSSPKMTMLRVKNFELKSQSLNGSGDKVYDINEDMKKYKISHVSFCHLFKLDRVLTDWSKELSQETHFKKFV